MNDQIRKDELDGMYGFVGETRNVYKILIAKCDRWYEIALKHTTVVKSCDSKTLCNARYLNQLATVSGLCVCVCVVLSVYIDGQSSGSWCWEIHMHFIYVTLQMGPGVQ